MDKQGAPRREQARRLEILWLLKKRGSISVLELAEYFGITKAAIRKHLDVLQKDRYIDANIRRKQMGRPTFVYRLTPAADKFFPSHYDGLAIEMMDDIDCLFGNSFVDKLFERRMERSAQKYRKEMAGKEFEERLLTLAKLQDEDGYMVKVEKRKDGLYLLEEANCPISHIAVRYRQACRCELIMFAALLDAHVERTECIADGNRKCRYLVREKMGETDGLGRP
ncbi:helix-turn-helix transcriptional regulator [Brevibacillus borstelensis]|uniref:helix-turn-helix transcriptional regulator n=1 Tax=Brevibacillus borstelensis TaxID=45462 RepID=UPI0030C2ADDC